MELVFLKAKQKLAKKISKTILLLAHNNLHFEFLDFKKLLISLNFFFSVDTNIKNSS